MVRTSLMARSARSKVSLSSAGLSRDSDERRRSWPRLSFMPVRNWDTVVKFAGNAAPLDILQFENARAEGAVGAQVLAIEIFAFAASGQFIEQHTEIKNQKKNGS